MFIGGQKGNTHEIFSLAIKGSKAKRETRRARSAGGGDIYEVACWAHSRRKLLWQSVAEEDGGSVIQPNRVDVGRLCREGFSAYVEDPLLSRRIPSEARVWGSGGHGVVYSR
jgi:hypothetical protein